MAQGDSWSRPKTCSRLSLFAVGTAQAFTVGEGKTQQTLFFGQQLKIKNQTAELPRKATRRLD